MEIVKSLTVPIRLDYTHRAGAATTRFLHGIAAGKILGQRCVKCARVYVPPRGACPRCAVPTRDEVEVAHTGTVTTFCIVRIPAENLSFDPPFACAHILLDGADIPFFHAVRGCDPADVRMGMRVKADWLPEEQRSPSLYSIRCFRPIDEPDVPLDGFREHL